MLTERREKKLQFFIAYTKERDMRSPIYIDENPNVENQNKEREKE